MTGTSYVGQCYRNLQKGTCKLTKWRLAHDTDPEKKTGIKKHDHRSERAGVVSTQVKRGGGVWIHRAPGGPEKVWDRTRLLVTTGV